MIIRGWRYADSKPEVCDPFSPMPLREVKYSRCFSSEVFSYNFSLGLYSNVVFIGS